MSLIIAGTVRFPASRIEALRPAAATMLAATRAEAGCIEYCFAEDVADRGLIRIFEIWRNQPALDAHFKTPHMDEWRAATANLGVSDRRLRAYDVASERQL